MSDGDERDEAREPTEPEHDKESVDGFDDSDDAEALGGPSAERSPTPLRPVGGSFSNAEIASMFGSPGVSRFLSDQQRLRRQMAEVIGANRLFAQQRLLAGYNRQMREAIARTVIPSGKQWRKAFRTAFAPDFFKALQLHRTQIARSLEGFARAARSIYPENLRGIDGLKIADVQSVVMDDGIALYGVPRQSIARSLVGASDTAKRRAILGRRWEDIAEDCRAVLDRCEAEQVQSDRKYALEAIAALEHGLYAAAQTLAANLLDTMLTKHFADERVLLVPGKKVKTPEGYDGFFVHKYWALAPVWTAYQQFWPGRGDPVPRRFARHATAHAVSHAQFSRRNAVQATMLVASLIVYLNDRVYSS